MDLKDEQWKLIESILPALPTRPDKRGRPWQDSRAVMNGILWVLRTGAPWKALPDRYPPYQTCHRRFQRWATSGIFEKILRMLAQDLKDRGGLDLRECFIDGSFAGAKKGVLPWGKLNEGRGPRSWQLQTALVFLSPYISKAPLLMKRDWLRKPLLKDLSKIDRKY